MDEIPAIGFGTWQLAEGHETVASVACALGFGYRLIDTARIYGNESSVGQAIGASVVQRDQIFVTTKLWTGDLGYHNALDAFEASLERLGLDYVDLYLIHWPGHDKQKRLDAWKALSEIQAFGGARAIGVSNFGPEQLQEILDTGTPPDVNQIEFNPFVYARQKPTLDFCDHNGIVVEAYSPLARGLVDNLVIKRIARDHGKTPAQVMLRWAIQQGTVPIPKSATPERIAENIDIFNFELDAAQMAALNKLSA